MTTQPLDPMTLPLSGIRLIEASAGTGKTYTIANLYLRLLLGHGRAQPLNVDQILVVTFTIAATEELRDRIRRRMLTARDGMMAGAADDPFIDRLIRTMGQPQVAIQLLDRALRHIDQATILTIHGFCRRVLEENAIESGLPFGLNVVTDETAMLNKAVEDFWRQSVATLQGDLLHLLPNWSQPQDLLKAITPYLHAHDVCLEPEPAFDWDDALSLRAAVDELKQLWLRDNIADLLRQAPFKGRARPGSEPRIQAMQAFCHGPALEFQHDNKESWELWGTAAIKSALPKAAQCLHHPIFNLFDEMSERFDRLKPNFRLMLMRQAIANIRQSMQAHKRQAAVLSSDDLLTRLRTALRDPEAGERLAHRVASHFPVAMVDEFQDTDGVQYDIFRSLYGNRSHSAWFIIGDPKQAIYKFRGADVYTYINARRQVAASQGVIYTLDTNWRSSSTLLSAINQLFARAETMHAESGAFLYRDDIPFSPVKPSAAVDDRPLLIAGKVPVPLTLWHWRGDTKAGTVSSSAARQKFSDIAAEAVVRLLSQATNDKVTIGGEPLEPGNIAILVRDSQQALAVQAALSARGVNSVFRSRERVFTSPIAVDLYHLLQAAMHPADERKLRTVLATPMLNGSAQDLAELDDDLAAMQMLLDEFADYHEIWLRFGVLAMLRESMARRDIAASLLARPEGQRWLTDLRQLGELLQQASHDMSGMQRLIRWYRRCLSGDMLDDGESQRIRLESDHNLVQIVTIHASKGLEFDVVLVPLASVARQDHTAIYHRPQDGAFVAVADLSNSPTALEQADVERLAEDLRLLYVALTRARYLCYAGGGQYWAQCPCLVLWADGFCTFAWAGREENRRCGPGPSSGCPAGCHRA